MADISCENLFSLACKSESIGNGNWYVDDDADGYSDDDDSVAAADDDDDDESSVLVMLSFGKWHVCKGMKCPHVEQSSEGDRQYTCLLSGRVVRASQESAHDASWTGRSCTSADPDMQSGAFGGVSAWKGKRNAFSASAAAYAAASTMTIGDISFGSGGGGGGGAGGGGAGGVGGAGGGGSSSSAVGRVVHDGEQQQQQPPSSSSQPPPPHESAGVDAKRGAPCVVDVDEEALNSQKRTKALKRICSLQDKTVQSRLRSDACTVVVKLFSVTHLSRNSSSSQPSNSAKAYKNDRALSGGALTLQDPRLENYDFVLNMAFKRYVSRCKEKRIAPTVSGIHDVCIATNQFVKKRKKDAAFIIDSASSSRKIAINGITVDLCSQLILTLWSAMCTTPHFVGNCTGDSFRPFAAGVMFALKRGLRLPNNIVLVPAIEEIASQLPTLRSSTATHGARQLQQASHRGLCAIQRGLASIDTMSHEEQAVAIKQLKIVSSVASRLVKFVAENASA